MGKELLPRNPGQQTLPGLMGRAALDPWLLLGATVIGGVGWAVGISFLAVVVAVVGLGVGAGVKVLTGGMGPVQKKQLAAPGAHTQPGLLLAALDGYVEDLTRLRESDLPDVVIDPVIEALVAANDARVNAAQVAAAVQALDQALDRSHQARTRSRLGQASAGVRQAEERMVSRRQQLIDNLNTAVVETAEVYTKLLELSATAHMSGSQDADGSVAAVNTSLDSLRTALGELERSTGDDPEQPF